MGDFVSKPIQEFNIIPYLIIGHRMNNEAASEFCFIEKGQPGVLKELRPPAVVLNQGCQKYLDKQVSLENQEIYVPCSFLKDPELFLVFLGKGFNVEWHFHHHPSRPAMHRLTSMPPGATYGAAT